MSIDVRMPILSDCPPDWQAVPPEILAMLAPNGLGYTTPEQRVELNRIARGRAFLVRNEAVLDTERPRCRRCGRKHEYITVACIEVPFNGLRDLQKFYETHDRGGTLIAAIRPGTIVPISRAKARDLEQRIRDARYQPVSDQQPLEATEVNVAALTHQIVSNARLGAQATDKEAGRRLLPYLARKAS